GVGESYIISESTNSGSYASNFTWSSSNTSVATVKKTTANKAQITAQNKGTAYIKITTYNGKTATCKVTVK
ncbi:MAG: Ig-like domain-containing protein, partial [Acutalibacteraceae bacterium]|nr:Ig-like domain-containing protein [Acutalibacteraceae bacterium]